MKNLILIALIISVFGCCGCASVIKTTQAASDVAACSNVSPWMLAQLTASQLAESKGKPKTKRQIRIEKFFQSLEGECLKALKRRFENE